MNNLQIKSNKMRLAINEDENRVVVINPGNSIERQKYYSLFSILEKKGKELQKIAKELDPRKDIERQFEIEEETFDFIAKELDKVFGEGTMNKVTEGEKDLDLIVQFVEGLAPYFKKYNKEKKDKYKKIQNDGVMK